MRYVALLFTLLVAGPAHAAEDFRVMRLEQDMRTLERHVQTLQRQVSDLQQQLRRAHPEAPRHNDSPATPPNDAWLSASAWERVRLGMSELQVIDLLGPPTALRPDAQGRRAMLYTLEIGTTAFLSGSISFADGEVVEVQRPTLR